MTTIKTVAEASAEGWLTLLVPAPLRGQRLEVVAMVQPEVRPDPSPDNAARRDKLRQVMERIAQRGGISSIPDPSAWQREARLDRVLPARAE